MKTNINIKRKFKINGSEYNSVEEMPDDARQLFEKAIASRASQTQAQTQSKIIFNGSEYANLEAMPPNVRQLYQHVLQAAETGGQLSDSDIASLTQVQPVQPVSSPTQSPAKSAPTSSRALFTRAAIALGVLLLYYLLRH